MIVTRGICQVCGKESDFSIENDAVLLREARCIHCGASIRNSDVAGQLKAAICESGMGLYEIKEELDKYRILNACSGGAIHNALKDSAGYTCCEFFDQVPSGETYNGVLCVDLCNMPFEDNTFDFVISEDVLEHIEGYEKALREIFRVLKPGGKHIFTVPLHEGRKTEGRRNKQKVYHGDPLHEDGCLVITDWGDDIADLLKKEGYYVSIEKKHVFFTPNEITNADNSYDEYLRKRDHMEQYFKYNSVVIEAEKPEHYENDKVSVSGKPQDLFTGERFVPGIHDIQLKMEHYQRYMSMVDMVRDKKVLDAACGEGYGSAILSKTAREVTGLDISADAIERARINYAGCDNLTFTEGSIAHLPFEDNSIDIIISFETIEHVTEELQRCFLAEIERVLKQDGILVISTPNKAIYTDLYKYHNEFHLKEFYKEEFLEFLNQKFNNVKLYNQYLEVVSVIDEAGKQSGSINYFKEDGQALREGKYYLAIASNADLLPINISSVFMNEEAEYNAKVTRIFQLQDEQEIKNQHIAKLDKEIEEKNQYILKLQSENTEYEERIQKYVDCIQEESEKKEKDYLRYQDKLKQIEKLENSLREKDEVLSVAEREVVLRGEHILKQDKELTYLRDYRERAEMEWGTRTYQLALKMRKLSAQLLPVNSKRRHLAGNIVKHINGAKVDSVVSVEAVEANKNLEEYECLKFMKQQEPEVSIIIPVYNQFEYTYQCLKSILENSADVSYEIIIADDNSTDYTMRLNEVTENIIKITNDQNLRFLKNCNHAAKESSGKYILFLNNDTQVQENWLRPLLDVMNRDEAAGIVGSKLVYADGTLQEAGGIVWRDASAWNYGNRKDAAEPEYNYVKEVDFISGAAMMIRRDLWFDIGGFDEKFAPAYYEDVDLAFEVRKRGYKVIYQPLSVVVHFEGVSNGTDVSDGQKSYQLVNQKKFYDKWQESLKKDHFENGTFVLLARDRSRYKKHILVVDHYVPHFDKDAGGRGTFMYLKLFMELGMQVTFIGDNFYKHEPYTTMLNQEGIEILYGSTYLNCCQRWIKENGSYFNYVYLQRPHIAVKYMDIVKEYTKAKIIYYDVDLCHVRELRQYEITKDEALLKSAERWKKIEFDLINKADVVHVVGSYEEEYLKKEFPGKPIRNIPLYIYPEARRDINKQFDRRKDLLFVGGFGHPPNEDAVLWFASEIFPKVMEKYPDIKWNIVGSKPSEAIQRLASDNIIIKGFVSDEELQKLYSNCRIDIVPLRYGAGVKGKVLEALYNQIPLITTSIGAEGLSKTEDAYWIAEGAKEITELILRLYEDYEALKQKSDNAILFINNNFTLKRAKEVLSQDMELVSN